MAPLNSLLLLAVLAISTLAIPPKSFVAHFDDIAAGPATLVVGNQVPNPYRNLCFNGGNVANKTLAVTGVLPRSKPNILGSAVVQRTQNGGVVSISAAPGGCTNTAAQSFDLSSFALGCQAATGQSAAEVPIACTLQVKGYTKGNSATPVVSTSVKYTPDNALLAKPAVFGLAGFKGLTKVTFGFGDAVQQTTTVTVMDDFTGIVRF